MLHFLLHSLHLESLWYALDEQVLVRATLALLTAFLAMVAAGPAMIALLQKYKLRQDIRDDGPSSHLKKSGTPTMGGALILAVLFVVTLFWSKLDNAYIWIALVVTLLFGGIGALDDYRKIARQNSKGLPAKWKYFLQSFVALAVAFYLCTWIVPAAEMSTALPFFGTVLALPKLLYIALCYFVLVGTSNAVNLTDGLDGLAIVPVAMVGVALGLLAYYSGAYPAASAFFVVDIKQAGELALFCATLAGAGLGFLWFNAHPAKVFMGDIGGLALGAALAIVAILIRQELLLFLIGGIFVAETLSVILQVGIYKLTGQRLFKMAPLHHHFEQAGWPEPLVVTRFWIASAIFVLIGLLAAGVVL